MHSRLPPDAPETHKALDALIRSPAWRERLAPLLLGVAKRLAHRTRVEPDDLFQRAVLRALRVASRGEGEVWDLSRSEELVDYFVDALKSERANALTRGYVKRTVLEKKDDDEPKDPHPDGAAEDVFRRDRRVQRGSARAEAVLGRLDELGREVFRAILDGTYDPARIAKARGLDVRLIYRARERVAYHAEAVVQAAPDSSGPNETHASESPERPGNV